MAAYSATLDNPAPSRLLAVCCLLSGLLSNHAFSQTERKLAPDALNVIAPAVEVGETFQGPVDLPLVAQNPGLRWQPNMAPESDTLLEMAKKITFRTPVHCLEFSFKPVRIIEVPVTTAQGKQNKVVWYLVYRVRYLGGDYLPVQEQDEYKNPIYGTPQAVAAKWVRFFPSLVFQSHSLKNVQQQRKLDSVIPSALAAVAARERIPNLYDSITIQREKLNIDQAYWAVATWTDIDPSTDLFSIEVQGLTNAQKIVFEGDQYKYPQKTLVLNFFRPGDSVNLTSDTVQYGVPAVNRLAGLKGELSKVLGRRDSQNQVKLYDYELTVTGGMEGKTDVPQQLLAAAQAIQQLGGENFSTYSRTASVLFTMKSQGQEKKVEEALQRQLGLKCVVQDRAIQLSEAIDKAEEAQDEIRQSRILQQYGLKERLDHYWIYR